MVSWLGKDEQDFGDFGVLGKSLVVISMISVIWGRSWWGDLGLSLVVISMISVI